MKKPIKITIPGQLRSLNEYISAMNHNRFSGAKMKKEDMEVVQWCCKGIKNTLKAPYLINFIWYCKDKRKDMDNISSWGRKVTMDALQEEGIIDNDNWRNISGFSDTFVIDKHNPRIEIFIHSLETIDNNKVISVL